MRRFFSKKYRNEEDFSKRNLLLVKYNIDGSFKLLVYAETMYHYDCIIKLGFIMPSCYFVLLVNKKKIVTQFKSRR